MKRGDTLHYTKTLAFNKGTQEIQSKIVAISSTHILLENGDSFHRVQLQKAGII